MYDIPISKITNDFLEYIHQLEKMEIEVASVYILFVATLMKIKSRMLLPRPELNEKGEEVDPREELIRNLLEYKKYKSVIEEMAQMESLRLSKEKRGNLAKELLELSKNEDVEAEMQHVDLYKLLKVFQKCMARLASRVDETKHTVIQYPYTIEQQKDFVLEKISFKKQVPFEEFIQFNPEKIFVIYTFLAILELLQLSLVTIIIGDGYNNFWVEKTEPIAAA
ncbi:MAG TPA: chromosome segregation protein ScpA [Bacillus bacterium]|nr:chromosome segregation protein ScpA [Bacillus sp. (in: firmicutes)]